MASRGQAGFDSTSRAKVQSKQPLPSESSAKPERLLDTVTESKCGGGHLCLLGGVDGLAHAVGTLLLRDLDDEALEVGQ